MPGIFFGPEWWNVVMFVVVPILLLVLVVAIWSIVSGFFGLMREESPDQIDKRKIPDIMGFLREHYASRRRRFSTRVQGRHVLRH
jgi:hypothetical protein